MQWQSGAGKKCAANITNKGPVSRICNSSYKSIRKKTNNPKVMNDKKENPKKKILKMNNHVSNEENENSN